MCLSRIDHPSERDPRTVCQSRDSMVTIPFGRKWYQPGRSIYQSRRGPAQQKPLVRAPDLCGKNRPSRPRPTAELGPELTRNLPNQISIFFFRIELNMHLIGQKMNHQAGILRIITKIKFNKKVKKDFSRSNLVENRYSIWEVCPPRHGLFCVTEAGHANWCHVIS